MMKGCGHDHNGKKTRKVRIKLAQRAVGPPGLGAGATVASGWLAGLRPSCPLERRSL